MSANLKVLKNGVIALSEPPEKWAHGDWYYSEHPRPCPVCRNHELQVVETQSAQQQRGGQRVAIHCPKCKATGEDTCHGPIHAARRWNWHMPELGRPISDIIPFTQTYEPNQNSQ